jgi:hypothetical protein
MTIPSFPDTLPGLAESANRQFVSEALTGLWLAGPPSAPISQPRNGISLTALLGDPAARAPTTLNYTPVAFRTAIASTVKQWEWFLSRRAQPRDPRDEIADHRISLKVATAEIAMHLDSAWRSGLFRQLDELLDDEAWDIADTLPTLASFKTFLRLIIVLGHPARPSLGCGDAGDIIASWIRAGNQLTIECRAGDQLRWSLVKGAGEDTETAAGICKVANLPSRLAPYEPEGWFDADKKHPGGRSPAAPRQGSAGGERP